MILKDGNKEWEVELPNFPKVVTNCRRCNGVGIVDVSIDATMVYVTCNRCHGDKEYRDERDMLESEKLHYLLYLTYTK